MDTNSKEYSARMAAKMARSDADWEKRTAEMKAKMGF